MAASVLKKIRDRAKRIVLNKPGMKYQTALKQAGREYREGMVSGSKRSAKSSHKRKVSPRKKAVGAKYLVTHRVKKIGKVTVSKDGRVRIGAMTLRQAKDQVDAKLAWELLAKDSARRVKERNAAQKKIVALRAAKRKLSDL
jgi:hypothetical protein